MENQETFELLLESNRITVERYINYRMPSSHDADDVIQETYLAAVKGFENLNNKGAFRAWILAIAKKQCDSWYRKKYRFDTVPIEAIENVAAIGEAVDDIGVSDIINQLPDKYKTVLELMLSGFDQREIAVRLGLPVGTVKSRSHYAKKLLRSKCPTEISKKYERGATMPRKDYLCGFPEDMPLLRIEKKDAPFFEVKFADDYFIIPKIGNKNSEGTYRYPDRKLAVVSTCRVTGAAVIHGVPGVKICRDTYNVREGKLYKNENIWFSQMTDEYVRDLGTIIFDDDDEFPTTIYTFLEDDYGMTSNENDPVRGRPLLIKERPPKTDGDRIIACEPNLRYTTGVYDVTIGERTFETVGFILPQPGTLVTENYVDRNGRLVLLRWYESMESIRNDRNYTDDFIERISDNPTIDVNGTVYILVEDRISKYAL